jgi:predicted RNase H-like HicB family nuclease
MNTKEKGSLRFLICKEGNEYVAVCLELNLIEYGKDPEILINSIEEAAQSYIEAVKNKNLSDDLLNQPAPKKYEKIWKLSKINNNVGLPSKCSLTEVKHKSDYFINTMMQSYSNQIHTC